eukprot:GHUV01033041.1.p1 GENE.GHUV01033041.1~~GHUV01033041.1.p1  ORF type:complete len:178 (+),score=19.20 GHUV01033041.1:827-1360(+)
MRWDQCFTSLADQRVSLPRFGHSAVAVNSPTANPGESGSDLVVVYGGVGLQAGETAQTALSDVVVLQVDSGTWFSPDILSGSSPGARAFHSAVALGTKVLVFGGHILTFDQQNNRKRRSFYNDIWQLDTVSELKRAAHSAVALGARVLVFGGHIPAFDQQNNGNVGSSTLIHGSWIL